MAGTGTPVEPTTARPHVELAPMSAATNEEYPLEERTRTRREESAERRQLRQERARIRRQTAATTAEPAASPGASSTTAAAHEALPGPAGRGRQHGTVKWFSDAKGYGFLQAEDGTDAFVHHSSISSDGFRTLSAGQAVSYDEAESPKGLVALNVVPTAQGSVLGEATQLGSDHARNQSAPAAPERSATTPAPTRDTRRPRP
jgi:CspA family cold shock protein